jgi:hypothetical protein
MMTSKEFPEFMTSIAYEYLDQTSSGSPA